MQLSSGARDLNFGLSFHLSPYFVCASSAGSGKFVPMRRLIRAFTACLCEHKNLMYWLTMVSFTNYSVYIAVLLRGEFY